MTRVTALSEVTNGAVEAIGFKRPYVARLTIQGTSDFLFHRWNVESIEEKANAAKGSKAKKTDDLESYVYRDEKGYLCIPGEYLRMAIINAAKFCQDPRSPRKSAMDLFKAGIVCLSDRCSLGVKDWDYLDRRRVTIQRSGITRVRPAVRSGYKITCEVQVLIPEYISSQLLNEVVQNAGRLIGIGDFRPTFGRFQVVRFDIV